jgi:hypothetical protein
MLSNPALVLDVIREAANAVSENLKAGSKAEDNSENPVVGPRRL